jgi:hypothetical protein
MTRKQKISRSLAQANRDRDRQAELIWAVRRGEVSMEEAVNDPRAAGIKVGHLFKQMPRHKSTRVRSAERIPRPILHAMFNRRIDPDAKVRELPDDTREYLAGAADRAQKFRP